MESKINKIRTAWQDPIDYCQRKSDADYLRNHCEEKSKDTSYVVNINGAWGSGKSFMLQHWHTEIAQAGSGERLSIYIDMWQKDFANNPLDIIVGMISEYLYDQIPNIHQNVSISDPLKKLWKISRLIGKGALEHYIGNETLAEISDYAVGEVGDLVMPEQLPSDKTPSEQFCEILNRLIHEVKRYKGVEDMVVYIFIDELDRCRPNFSISVLESVKHLFNIPGFIFIIASNTRELQHSIKSVYGQDFDAQVYLGRFFNITYELSTPDITSFSNASNLELDPDRVDMMAFELFDGRDLTYQDLLGFMANPLGLTLRETLQCHVQLEVLLSSTEGKWALPTVLVLISLRLKNPTLFDECAFYIEDIRHYGDDPLNNTDAGNKIRWGWRNLEGRYLTVEYPHAKLLYETVHNLRWVFNASDAQRQNAMNQNREYTYKHALGACIDDPAYVDPRIYIGLIRRAGHVTI